MFLLFSFLGNYTLDKVTQLKEKSSNRISAEGMPSRPDMPSPVREEALCTDDYTTQDNMKQLYTHSHLAISRLRLSHIPSSKTTGMNKNSLCFSIDVLPVYKGDLNYIKLLIFCLDLLLCHFDLILKNSILIHVEFPIL